MDKILAFFSLDKQMATKILRIVVIIIIILVLIYIIRNRRVLWGRFRSLFVGYSGDFRKLTESEKSLCESIAKELRDKIYGSYFADKEETLIKILNMDDSMFFQTVKYYNLKFGSIIDDIESEIMPFTDADEKLVSRATGMGFL